MINLTFILTTISPLPQAFYQKLPKEKSVTVNKKDFRIDRKSLMVELAQKNWHQVIEEAKRWHGIIGVQFNRSQLEKSVNRAGYIP